MRRGARNIHEGEEREEGRMDGRMSRRILNWTVTSWRTSYVSLGDACLRLRQCAVDRTGSEWGEEVECFACRVRI